MKKYTMSDKRKAVDINKANWEQRLEILRLVNQGWSYRQIAKKIGSNHQNVHQIYTKIKDMTVEEAEQYAS